MASDKPIANTSRRRALQALGSAAMVSVAGCSGSGGDDDGNGGEVTTTTTSTPSSDTSEPIDIGAPLPLSGAFSALGEASRNGVDAAVKYLNDQGGINGRQLNPIYEDTEVDPSTGRQKARRLIEEEQVDVMLGGVSGAVALSIADLTYQNDLIYWPVASTEDLTAKECKPTTFRYQTSTSQAALAGGQYFAEQLGGNVWIHYSDYAYGQAVLSTWKSAIQSAEVDTNIVNETKTPIGTNDFSSYISQISSSNADWVLIGMSGSDAVNFLKQADQFGLKTEVDIVGPTLPFRVIREGAGSAAYGTYGPLRYVESFDTEANRTFKNFFNQVADTPPDSFAELTWGSLDLYAKAAEQAGSIATGDIIPELEGIQGDEPMGSTEIRKCDHQATREFPVGQLVEPDQGEVAELQADTTVNAEDAIPPCDQTGCNMESYNG